MSWLPNLLTMARCVLAFVIAILILRLGAAEPPAFTAAAPFLLFCIVALTDFLDGYLARRLDAVSAFGAFLDPVADKLLVALSLLAYCVVSGWAVVLVIPTALIIVRDVAVTFARLRPGRSIPVSRLAKLKTALEMTGIGGLLLAIALAGSLQDPQQSALILVSWVAIWLAAALSAWTAWQYFRS